MLLRLAGRLSWGAGQVAVANGVAAFVMFVASIIVVRLGGASELGRFGLIIALGSVVGGIVDLGTDRVLTQRVAEMSSGWTAAWRALIWLKGGGLSIAVLVALLYFGVRGDAFEALLVLYAIGTSVWLTLQGLASALHRLGRYTIFRIVSRVGGFVALAAAAAVGVRAHPAALAVTSLFVWDIATACLLWFALRAHLARLPSSPASRSASWLAFRQALPLGVSSLAVWLYVKLDTILLGLTTDLITLGAYTAAVRLAELLGGLSTALNAVLLPAFARLSVSEPENFRRARDATITTVVFGVGLLSLVVFCFADALLAVAFKLPASAPYLQILVWGQIYAVAGVICAVDLQVRGRGRSIAEITVLTSLISIPLYVVLIKIGGAVGAAVATLVSYALILPIGLGLRPSRTTFVPLLRASIVLMPAVAAGLGTFLYLGGFRGPRFAHALMAMLAYCVVVAIGGVLLVRSSGPRTVSAGVGAG